MLSAQSQCRSPPNNACINMMFMSTLMYPVSQEDLSVRFKIGVRRYSKASITEGAQRNQVQSIPC